MIRPLALPVCVLGACQLLACTGDRSADSGGLEDSVRDSAGVRVVETSGRALQHPLPWLRDTVPDLELGGPDGEGPQMFARITGIAAVRDGSVVVVDGGSPELRWFDASGVHLRSMGRQGGGPSEFRRPELVPQFDGDSLLIFDRTGRRFVRVASDGSGMAVISLDGLSREQLAGLPQAAWGTSVLFLSTDRSTDGCAPNQPCDMPRHLRSVDFETGAGSTLAVFPGRWMNYVPDDGMRVMLDGRLDNKGLVVPGPEGWIVEGAWHYSLERFDASGELQMIMRLDAPTEAVTDETLAADIARSSDPAGTRQLFDMMEMPEVLPAFQALEVDGLGMYWAELFRLVESAPPEWLVFDREGQARGVVTFPVGYEVHVIGDDYVLGLWRDELGVEYVRRYSLNRAP